MPGRPFRPCSRRAALPRVLLLALLVLPGVGAAQTPDWSVTPSQFGLSMDFVGTVALSTSEVAAEGDLLAAFVDEEVRGVAEPVATGGGQQTFFLTIYGRAQGEAVQFQYYDASADLVLALDEGATFVPGEAVGSIGTPFPWHAADLGRQCEAGTAAWAVDPAAYESSMSVFAEVAYGGRPAGPGDVLAAFVDEEVRGVAEAQASADGAGWVFVLTVFGEAQGAAVSFQAYDAQQDRRWAVAETLAFSVNEVAGTPSAPLSWTGFCAAVDATPTALDEVPAVDAAATLGPVWPQPATAWASAELAVPWGQEVAVGLYDLLGRRVRGVWAGPAHGRMDLRVDVSGLPAGLYLLRARGATVSATRPLVVAR